MAKLPKSPDIPFDTPITVDHLVKNPNYLPMPVPSSIRKQKITYTSFRPQCTAHAKHKLRNGLTGDDARCQRHSEPYTDKCKHHGGRTLPKGGGKSSKFPERNSALKTQLEKFENNPDLLSAKSLLKQAAAIAYSLLETLANAGTPEELSDHPQLAKTTDILLQVTKRAEAIAIIDQQQAAIEDKRLWAEKVFIIIQRILPQLFDIPDNNRRFISELKDEFEMQLSIEYQRDSKKKPK